MAEKMKSYEFKGGFGGGGSKYPWSEWLDGDPWKIEQEDCGDTDIKFVAAQARNAGKRRHLRVRVSLHENEGYFVCQAFPMTEEEIAEMEAKKTATNGEMEVEETQETEPAMKKGNKKSRKSA